MQDLRAGPVPVVQEGVAAAGSAALAVVLLAALGPWGTRREAHGNDVVAADPLADHAEPHGHPLVDAGEGLVEHHAGVVPAGTTPAARLMPHQQVHGAAGHRR